MILFVNISSDNKINQLYYFWVYTYIRRTSSVLLINQFTNTVLYSFVHNWYVWDEVTEIIIVLYLLLIMGLFICEVMEHLSRLLISFSSHCSGSLLHLYSKWYIFERIHFLIVHSEVYFLNIDYLNMTLLYPISFIWRCAMIIVRSCIVDITPLQFTKNVFFASWLFLNHYTSFLIFLN